MQSLSQQQYNAALRNYNAQAKQTKYSYYRITNWFDLIGVAEAVAYIQAAPRTCSANKTQGELAW